MTTCLRTYAIFERPLDVPRYVGCYVVRAFFVVRDSAPLPSPLARYARSLDSARSLVPAGLVRVPRSDGDVASLVETWI